MENSASLNCCVTKKINNRHYGLDLCRIICMLFVICWHYIEVVIHFDSNLLSMIFIVHCNTFFMITGYFMCDKTAKISNLIKIWLEIIFYSLVAFIISCSLKEFKFDDIAFWTGTFLPIISGSYWFMTAYFIVYILSPLLNKLIKSMSKGCHLLTCIVLVLLFAVINNLFGKNAFLINYGLCWMWSIVLYFIGSYIKKYIDSSKINILLLIGLVIGFAFLHTLVSSLLYLGFKNGNQFVIAYFGNSGHFRRYNELLSLGTAIPFFLIFTKIKINNVVVQKIIDIFSRHSLASYLIHCNFLLSLHFGNGAWQLAYEMEPYRGLAYVCFVLIIFFGSILIDIVRYYMFKPIASSKLVYNLWNKIDSLPIKFINKINTKKV